MTQALIKNNKHAVKHSFKPSVMRLGAYYGGPVINTVLCTINAIFLKVKAWKIILILLGGLLFSAVYVYLLFLHNIALDFSFMIAGGLSVYLIYYYLSKIERRILGHYRFTYLKSSYLYLTGLIIQIFFLLRWN